MFQEISRFSIPLLTSSNSAGKTWTRDRDIIARKEEAYVHAKAENKFPIRTLRYHIISSIFIAKDQQERENRSSHRWYRRRVDRRWLHRGIGGTGSQGRNGDDSTRPVARRGPCWRHRSYGVAAPWHSGWDSSGSRDRTRRSSTVWRSSACTASPTRWRCAFLLETETENWITRSEERWSGLYWFSQGIGESRENANVVVCHVSSHSYAFSRALSSVALARATTTAL